MNLIVRRKKLCLFLTVKSIVVVIKAAVLTFRIAPRAII